MPQKLNQHTTHPILWKHIPPLRPCVFFAKSLFGEREKFRFFSQLVSILETVIPKSSMRKNNVLFNSKNIYLFV